jgi:FixJ family two-component response regulator
MNMPVFVVDDNEHICEFITFLLSELGHQVHAFESPDEALAFIEAQEIRPRILISDFNMPGMNGVELHEAICQLEPKLKTIIISGRRVEDRIGGLPFLCKPFPPQHLIQMIEKL